MHPEVRLFGPDRVEITDLDSWLIHAPPEKGEAQWKDGYSAKEQAKAWLRSGSPALPAELSTSIAPMATGNVDEVYGSPEHDTKLDRYGKGRQHDLLACVRRQGKPILVVGIEAKACEDFDGVVTDRAASAPPSNKRARCNLLAQALFGKEVLDETSGEVLDERLGNQGYQLWTAAVGTIIEAQRRRVDRAALIVHQFRPSDPTVGLEPGDMRDWPAALAANAKLFDSFAAAVQAAGSTSHRTEFVEPGTSIYLAKVETVISS